MDVRQPGRGAGAGEDRGGGRDLPHPRHGLRLGQVGRPPAALPGPRKSLLPRTKLSPRLPGGGVWRVRLRSVSLWFAEHFPDCTVRSLQCGTAIMIAHYKLTFCQPWGCGS